MAFYSLYLCDPFGVRLTDAAPFISLQYSRKVNDIGKLVVTLPGDFGQNLIRIPDGRIEVWRKLPGASREYLETETTWLIKKRTQRVDGQGRTTLTLEAHTPLCVLRSPGRFVDGTIAVHGFTDRALDDAIKDIVRQTIGNDAGSTARDLSQYITVAPDLTLAPINSKSYTWRDALKVMQECAAASAQQGVYLAFDIVAPTPTALEFRTYVGQRGVDHRWPGGANPVLIGPELGNMGECELIEDYADEVTYVKAGGKGEGGDRLVGTAQDDTRIAKSPFGRRELFVSATQYTTSTGLQAEAEAVLYEERVRQSFRGKLLDTQGARYGVQWSWGDSVTVQAFGQLFDCRIDAIAVKVDRGTETVEAWLRNDL